MDETIHTETLEEKLTRLHNLETQAANIKAHYDQLAQQAIPSEVHQALDAITAELEMTLHPLLSVITDLETEIMTGTVRKAESVYTDHLMSVYNPGGESVKAADVKLCAARWQNVYPKVSEDILTCIKSKKASASIQARKGNNHA